MPDQTNTDKKPGLLYEAMPSDGIVRVMLSETDRPRAVFPGHASFMPWMLERIEDKAVRVMFGPGVSALPSEPDWIINPLADADSYPDALAFLDRYLASNPTPVFNHPRAVVNTQRHTSSKLLQGIPNLIAPKCERFSPKMPTDFPMFFEKMGFAYPVLVRPVGTHTALDLISVERPEDWAKVHSIKWAGVDVYMTQFVNYQNAEGKWCKIRLFITPNHVGLVHIYFYDDWLVNNRVVHANTRPEEIWERELAYIQSMPQWTVLQNVGAAIRERVGLDYFGVDMGWKSENEFVLFEANASMSMLKKGYIPPYRSDDYIANIDGLGKNLWRAVCHTMAAGSGELSQGAVL